MKKHSLAAKKREVVGRKVKNLRKNGELPATVYGKKVDSVSVTINRDEFLTVYKEAGETGLIELSIEKQVRPVLVNTVQIDPVSSETLHVEFHQVDLKEKVHAKVPVEIVGESPAIAQKLGVLLTVIDEIEVEALPTDLPEKIIVDVSTLENVDQELKVQDLDVKSAVTVLTDAELTVVKVGPLVTKEAEAQATEEAASAEAAAATTEAAAEGAAADEKASQEKTPADKKE
jgi:large subunit ribosomal protein L25